MSWLHCFPKLGPVLLWSRDTFGDQQKILCFLISFSSSDKASHEKQEKETLVLVYSVAGKISDTGDNIYHEQNLSDMEREKKKTNNFSMILCRWKVLRDVQKNMPLVSSN